jgi:hypothetical protein
VEKRFNRVLILFNGRFKIPPVYELKIQLLLADVGHFESEDAIQKIILLIS